MEGFPLFLNLAEIIIKKLPVTLLMLILALVVGLLIGLLFALVRIKNKGPLNYLVTIIISYLRCTPVLVQLFIAYYGFPLLVRQLGGNIDSWSPMIFAIITFGLSSSAYFSEMFRSAYLAVDNGQLEAAYSVGMTYSQAVRRIILPQAIVIAIPNLTGNTLYLMKESALAFSIGIVDMLGQAEILLMSGYGINFLHVYLFIALIYWILSIIIQKIGDFTEAYMKKGIQS